MTQETRFHVSTIKGHQNAFTRVMLKKKLLMKNNKPEILNKMPMKKRLVSHPCEMS